MDKRYSINEIAEMLAEKTDKQTTDIEKFLKEFVIIVNEGITKDNYVKIKGIGVFKVVLVNERESIHVNTGERFIIPSHHKVSFVPENRLKTLINRPFAAFEAIEAQEDGNGLMNMTTFEKEEIGETEETITNFETAFDGSQLRITNDELSNIKHSRDKDIGETEESLLPPPFVPPIEEKPLLPPPSPPIEYKPTPQHKEIILPPSQQQYIEQKPLQSSTSSHSLRSAKHNKKRKKKSKKSSMMLLYIILFFLLFVLVGGGIWYFLFYNNKYWDEYDSKLSSRITGSDEIVSPVDSMPSDIIVEEVPLVSDTFDNMQSRADTTNVVVSQPTTSPPSTAQRQETVSRPTTSIPTTTSSDNNVLARITIERGQRLTLLAENYYGEKVFWVYIYEYNKAKIGSNPNQISVGMEILIPAKELYGIDANSASSISKATAIQRQIMEGLNYYDYNYYY